MILINYFVQGLFGLNFSQTKHPFRFRVNQASQVRTATRSIRSQIEKCRLLGIDCQVRFMQHCIFEPVGHGLYCCFELHAWYLHLVIGTVNAARSNFCQRSPDSPRSSALATSE